MTEFKRGDIVKLTEEGKIRHSRSQRYKPRTRGKVLRADDGRGMVYVKWSGFSVNSFEAPESITRIS